MKRPRLSRQRPLRSRFTEGVSTSGALTLGVVIRVVAVLAGVCLLRVLVWVRTTRSSSSS